jgi:hypothetical protein
LITHRLILRLIKLLSTFEKNKSPPTLKLHRRNYASKGVYPLSWTFGSDLEARGDHYRWAPQGSHPLPRYIARLPASPCTGTAIVEAKLFQQLASIQQVPVFKVFLDLKYAHVTLDRGRTLEILEHGVGEKALRLLRQFWDRHVVVAKQGGRFSVPFKATRGVTKGGITSPSMV